MVTHSFFGVLIIVPIIFIIFILLQIFLSTRNNPWLGLILPGIQFVFACIVGIGRLLYDFQTTFVVIFSDILLFFLYNIPTAILLAIYWACRQKHNRKAQLEKMNLQDLE
jgi:hypothetical protein